MTRKKYRFHPACTVFPQISDAELKNLADDIAVNGLRNPIVLWKGKILDGRNRYLACEIAKVKPRFTQFEGNDPIGWVISQNLHRRHLTASQKAVVALAEQLILTFSREGDLVCDPFCGSGSSLVAAKQLSRDFCGFDGSKKYVRMALERLTGANNDGRARANR